MQFDAFAPSKTVPSLDLKYLYIQQSFNNVLDSKSLLPRYLWNIFKFFIYLFQNAIFWQNIDDMTAAISITLKTLYIADQDMKG